VESARLLCYVLLRAGKEKRSSASLVDLESEAHARGRLASRRSWSWRSRRAP
jgi:hypothetical protein